MSEDKPVVSRWRRVGLHLLTVLLVLSVVVAVNVWRTRDAPAGMAPPIVGVLASGQQITLDEFRAQHTGRPVALYFWAEWCPVCRAEAHVVTRVMKDYPVLTIASRTPQRQRRRRTLHQARRHHDHHCHTVRSRASWWLFVRLRHARQHSHCTRVLHRNDRNADVCRG